MSIIFASASLNPDPLRAKFFAAPVLFFSVFILSFPSFLSAAPAPSHTIAPERDITTTVTAGEPEWKGLWDEARKMTRQEKYPEAARLYSQLFSIKKNIEEASWEYCLVLIALSDWRQASVVVEGLLEVDAQRTEYLLSGGLVALKMKEYARAATCYRLAYQNISAMEGQGQPQAKDVQVSRAPGGEPAGRSIGSADLDHEQSQAIEALTGLIASLQGAGIHEEAYPFMERLLQLRPDDPVLLHQLAVYAAKSGRHEKAMGYYKKLIAMETVEDHILLEAAQVFESSGMKAKTAPGASDTQPSLAFGRSSSIPGASDTQPSLAFACWEKYLQRHPDYLPFQKKIADYLLFHGEKAAALPHLLILLSEDEHRHEYQEYLLPVGAIYLNELRRPDKALPYYQDYLRRHPENAEIAGEITRIENTLAQDLAARVDHAGADSLWKELEPVAPNRLAIYRSMADLLERRGNRKELGEALAIIHRHDPENREVALRLAELALEENDVDQAEHFLGLLSLEKLETRQQTRYLLARAQNADQRRLSMQALSWYGQYLEASPGDTVIRRRCLELSASLGLVNEYEQNYQVARHHAGSEQERLEMDLRYVRVLLTNGLATRARITCLQLIEDGQGSQDFLAECRLALADALSGEGNIFEAEQVLRQMLADGLAIDRTLDKLVEFSVANKEPGLAQNWFALLSERVQKTSIPAPCDDDGRNLSLLQAKVLAAAGKTGKAIDILTQYRQVLASQCPGDAGRLREADYSLAYFCLLDRQYNKGRKLVADVLEKNPADLEALILERQLGAGRSGKGNGDPIDDVLGKTYGNEFLSLMRAARLEQKYGDLEAALKYTRMAVQEMPESISARVALAEILEKQGDLAAAFPLWQALAADYPQEIGFTRKLLEGEFKQGKFQQIIAKLAPSRPPGFESAIIAFPDTGHLLTWQKLILARALWAERQWVAAVAVYDALLQPSVEKIFSEQIEEQQVQLVLPPPQQSLWNIITFTAPAEPDRLTQVMEPVFVLSQSGQPAGRIGADLYADYRWQQLTARELSARRALAQGDYYQAMKEYQEVIAKDPSPESLFDLAGIYSRLGLLGKEALLYEEIERDNPGYPDLAASLERNRLKRQPKVMADFGYSSLSGRDGYLDMKQTRGGGSVWMLPTLRQEFSAGWSTSHAVSNDTDQDLWRNRLLATYSFYPHYAIDFVAKLGADKNAANSEKEYGDTDEDITPLFHFETRGRIGDELHGFVRLSQDVVDDTVQALQEGITKRDLEGGVSMDLLPRLFCGGEYLYGEYSDSNHQNRYHVWVSYILLREPTLLRVTYGQELLDNAESNQGRNDADHGLFAPGDHPYWSPNEYWQNLVSVHFEHQLAADVFGRRAPSYYTLDYSVGYEEGGYDNHSFGGDIFLEMSRHFLLNSSFDMTQGGQEIRKDFALSLVYRW